MKKIVFIVLFVCLCARLHDVSSNRFVYVNPGQNNIISVSPLSLQQIQSTNNFIGSGANYRYNWNNLPSWATSNGSTFYGIIPEGISGTQPITVQYFDSNGNSGIFSFTLNYAGLSSAGSTIASGPGSFNIINGVNSAGITVTNGDNSQLILIPNSTQTQIQTTTQITSNSQITRVNNGAGCATALNNLNNANNALTLNTNNFVAINNQLNNANNTLINLKLNQTTVTTQLQQYTLQANVSNNNISQITSTISSLQNNLTTLENQFKNINNKIQQDQNQLQQLINEQNNLRTQQTSNGNNIAVAQQNVTNAQNALNNLNNNIQNATVSFNSIQGQFTSFQTQINNLNNLITASNAKVLAAQNALRAALEEQNQLNSNRTQILNTYSQLNTSFINAQTTLQRYQNQQPQLQNILDIAIETLRSLQNNAVNPGILTQTANRINQLQNSINNHKANSQSIQNQISSLNQQLNNQRSQITLAQNTKTQIQTQLNLYQAQLQNIQGQVNLAINNLDSVISRYNSALTQINRNKDNVNLMTQRLNECRNLLQQETISSLPQTQTFSTTNVYSGTAGFATPGSVTLNNRGSTNAGQSGLGIEATTTGTAVTQNGSVFVNANGNVYNQSSAYLYGTNQGGFGSQTIPYTTTQTVTTRPSNIQISLSQPTIRQIQDNSYSYSQTSGITDQSNIRTSPANLIGSGYSSNFEPRLNSESSSYSSSSSSSSGDLSGFNLSPTTVSIPISSISNNFQLPIHSSN